MDADDIVGPDGSWLITINPQERPELPGTMVEINSRRNKLSRNLSLNAIGQSFRQVVDQQLAQPSGAVTWDASPVTARRKSHTARGNFKHFNRR
ncbi:hypothetical protein [Natronorubrum sp. A-ect3]|uniref:hypothetical protein n=1 Tax=Natronorubrum sp. A-ect3 TaxID=3242698 RepID=UPI00359E4B1A